MFEPKVSNLMLTQFNQSLRLKAAYSQFRLEYRYISNVAVICGTSSIIFINDWLIANFAEILDRSVLDFTVCCV